FLDTRGLGEVAYDPSDDIAFCEGRAHLIVAVVKALDVEQQVVLDVLRAVRQRHPDWPVVVAQTSLHEAYSPGQSHPLPYPFRPPPCPTASPAPSNTSAACSKPFPVEVRCASCPSTSRDRATGSIPPTTAA